MIFYLYSFFNVKRFFVHNITATIELLKNKVDPDSPNILKKTVTSSGQLDCIPTKYYKVFRTLTKQEFSKIRKECQKVSLIYLWYNKETKHCYVGSPINFSHRLMDILNGYHLLLGKL